MSNKQCLCTCCLVILLLNSVTWKSFINILCCIWLLWQMLEEFSYFTELHPAAGVRRSNRSWGEWCSRCQTWGHAVVGVDALKAARCQSKAIFCDLCLSRMSKTPGLKLSLLDAHAAFKDEACRAHQSAADTFSNLQWQETGEAKNKTSLI